MTSHAEGGEVQVRRKQGFFSTFENEELIEAATEEQYSKAQVCPNCHENRDDWIEMWPNHSFVLRKCLSCGQYFSIVKNLRNMGVTVSTTKAAQRPEA